MKEEYTRGFHVLKQGNQDQYLYFIFRGKCRLLLSTRVPPMATVFPVSIQERNEWLILDTLNKGQAFGEITALNPSTPSPYTVEVCSETVTLLKIHINQFHWYFGEEEGEPSLYLRSQVIMKTNWLRMKKQFLAYMSKEKLLQLEYRDDPNVSRLNPTSK